MRGRFEQKVHELIQMHHEAIQTAPALEEALRLLARTMDALEKENTEIKRSISALEKEVLH